MSLQKLALELAALEKLKLEMQKEMERIAIRSIVNSTQSKVKASGQQILRCIQAWMRLNSLPLRLW